MSTVVAINPAFKMFVYSNVLINNIYGPVFKSTQFWLSGWIDAW